MKKVVALFGLMIAIAVVFVQRVDAFHAPPLAKCEVKVMNDVHPFAHFDFCMLAGDEIRMPQFPEGSKMAPSFYAGNYEPSALEVANGPPNRRW